jgi:hypothetical protein
MYLQCFLYSNAPSAQQRFHRASPLLGMFCTCHNQQLLISNCAFLYKHTHLHTNISVAAHQLRTTGLEYTESNDRMTHKL